MARHKHTLIHPATDTPTEEHTNQQTHQLPSCLRKPSIHFYSEEIKLLKSRHVLISWLVTNY